MVTDELSQWQGEKQMLTSKGRFYVIYVTLIIFTLYFFE